ncbi:GNAT family N-acetyltransferase [Pseudomonas vanderleydeniana]|uniref:GNAT family N-acetyltransferase n=1 Tax=Pseudomonas vanderleydeniana TaxID=2745495 RepID=A0A9E6PNS6_9PSED|nr:GNAT family protein [Pseudomonas vanderleydeniana]QXI29536.1 GNAT family N-acetyltransferase [Pseudomonas vanderleydeniana]
MDIPLPRLGTRRLWLSALEMSQAETLSRLADEPEIAANTATIPSPYTVETAQAFIAGQEERHRSGHSLGLGIQLKHNAELIGVISLRFSPAHRSAHLGYWVAAHARRQGHAVEAVTGLLEYGFNELGLHRIAGQCFARNSGSARVMEKAGLRPEGCMKGAFLKHGVHEDMLLFGLLREHWHTL